MNKSPDAFRTISEVAETLDVPPHVLRFWETRFTQVKPVKRGGGRRYYRPEDVRLLRGIRGLLYDDGMTIKGVQKILRERGIRHVIGLGTLEDGGTEAFSEPTFVDPANTAPASGIDEGAGHDTRSAEATPEAAGADDTPEPVAVPPAPLYPRLVETVGEGPQRDLFAAVPTLATEGETAIMPIDRPTPPEPTTTPPRDKAALRALVAQLVALRAVMTEDKG